MFGLIVSTLGGWLFLLFATETAFEVERYADAISTLVGLLGIGASSAIGIWAVFKQRELSQNARKLEITQSTDQIRPSIAIELSGLLPSILFCAQSCLNSEDADSVRLFALSSVLSRQDEFTVHHYREIFRTVGNMERHEARAVRRAYGWVEKLQSNFVAISNILARAEGGDKTTQKLAETHLKRLLTDLHKTSAASTTAIIIALAVMVEKDPELQAELTFTDGMAPSTSDMIRSAFPKVLLPNSPTLKETATALSQYTQSLIN
jgi:hypothetical protein